MRARYRAWQQRWMARNVSRSPRARYTSRMPGIEQIEDWSHGKAPRVHRNKILDAFQKSNYSM